MSTSLQELLKIAGLLADPNAKRPRIADPSQGMHGEIGDGINATPIGAVPPIPDSAQPPPRSLPPITPEPPPSADIRPRFVDQANNAQNERVQSFGSSGEPFGTSRERRTQPRDYVADDLAYARELERQPRNKKLDVLTGITQGIAALEGNQPKQPWNYSGRERKLNEVYGRLGKELDVQKDQAAIKNAGSLQDYRNRQVFGSQQKRMIDLYKSLPKYIRGERPEIDAMFESAGLQFENKDPKTAKPGATKMFRMNGQQYILPSGTTEAQVVTGQGGTELLDPTQVPVEATGAVSGETYTVRPGTALGAEAATAGRMDTAARSDRQFGQGAYQFETQQQQQQMARAGAAYDDWVKLDADADSDEAAANALELKRQEQGALFGQDAMDLIGYQSRAQARRKQAQAKAEQIRRSHGDFYDVGPDGVPKPKEIQSPAAPQPPSTAKPRLQVNHAKFETDYANAKTPEEKAKILKLYTEAVQKAGSQ